MAIQWYVSWRFSALFSCGVCCVCVCVDYIVKRWIGHKNEIKRGRESERHCENERRKKNNKQQQQQHPNTLSILMFADCVFLFACSFFISPSLRPPFCERARAREPTIERMNKRNVLLLSFGVYLIPFWLYTRISTKSNGNKPRNIL